jgi:hypothetical protein
MPADISPTYVEVKVNEAKVKVKVNEAITT